MTIFLPIFTLVHYWLLTIWSTITEWMNELLNEYYDIILFAFFPRCPFFAPTLCIPQSRLFIPSLFHTLILIHSVWLLCLFSLWDYLYFFSFSFLFCILFQPTSLFVKFSFSPKVPFPCSSVYITFTLLPLSDHIKFGFCILI